MTLRIHTSVFERMREEARRYSVETGGLILGPNETTISTLIPSGTAAHRSSTSYELDTQNLQPKIDAAIRRGLYFLGVWHVHPEGCNELSKTDWSTAQQMLADPTYRLRRVILPLTVRHRGQLRTRFFTAERGATRFCEVPVTAVHSENEPVEAQNVMRHAGLSVDERVFAQRLIAERSVLESSGWTVSIRESDGTWAACASKDDLVIWAMLPAEYPLNPPDLFAESQDGLVSISHHDVPELTIWSSARSLPVAINQAARAICAEREAERLFRPRRLRNVLCVASKYLRRTMP